MASSVFHFCIFAFAYPVSAYWQLQYFSSVDLSLLSLSIHIDICSASVLYTILWLPRFCILISAVFQFWVLLCIWRLCILISAVFCFFMLYFACLVSANWHLQYFSSVILVWFPYFNSISVTLLSSSLRIDICSVLVLYIWLCFPCLCILTLTIFQSCDLLSLLRLSISTSAVFQFCVLLCLPHLYIFLGAVFYLCIFYYACLVSANWHLQYFSSVYFNLVSLSLHIGICSISITLLSSSFHLDISSVPVLYISFYFPRLFILTSAVFLFSIFYFAFPFCAYYHLQYFSSVHFNFLSSSLLICICIISLLYILLYFPHLCILASVVLQSCILYFAFLVYLY